MWPSCSEGLMLPNLVIIGAMKSATTSLHYYLSLHPQIDMSREKELDFFVAEQNWKRGLSWYQSQFTGDAPVHGESSTRYTHHPFLAGVPERMHSVIPDAKLIYLLRDPVRRIISHWVHVYSSGVENRSFAEAVRNPRDNRYLAISKYYMQLEQFLRYYPETSILILTTEELHQHRQATMQRAFRFLGVDDTFSSPRFATFRQKSSYKRRKTRAGVLLSKVIGTSNTGLIRHLPPQIRGKVDKLVYLPVSRTIKRPVLGPELQAQLIQALRTDVNGLREHTGEKFEAWCV